MKLAEIEIDDDDTRHVLVRDTQVCIYIAGEYDYPECIIIMKSELERMLHIMNDLDPL